MLFLTDAGGVGLNLQRAASACINLELPWNPAVLEQRIGRIYRLGQKTPIDVFNLMSEESIEGRIAALVGAKQAVFAGLFDGTSDVVRFDAASTLMGRVRALVDVDVRPAGASAASTDAGDEADAPAFDATDTLEVGVAPAAPDVVVDPAAPEREPRAATAAEMTNLFASLRVHHAESGAIRIEAPPTLPPRSPPSSTASRRRCCAADRRRVSPSPRGTLPDPLAHDAHDPALLHRSRRPLVRRDFEPRILTHHDPKD